MKIHEIIYEDDDMDNNPERSFVNPLPIVDASTEFDLMDELDNTFIADFRLKNNLDDNATLGSLGKIMIAGREKYGKVEKVPISKIVTIEPYLNPEHLKSLVSSNNNSTGEMPLLLKYNGRYIAADGNHRIVANMQRGENTVQGLVLDLNKFQNNR